MGHPPPKAVVLLSGGLDSATTGALARERGFAIYALTFRYGQRHQIETEAATRVARAVGVERHIVQTIDLRVFGGSALTGPMDVPKAATPPGSRRHTARPSAATTGGTRGYNRAPQKLARGATKSNVISSTGSPPAGSRGHAPPRAVEDRCDTDAGSRDAPGCIPVTYVPARNTIFLSFALAYAEVLGASDLFIGVNAVDYSGYPDCRPEFIAAFEKVAALATKAGVEGSPFVVHAPLITLSKAEIIREGLRLGVDFAQTHSCYDPTADGLACALCESCLLRRKGFQEAGVADPIRYVRS